MDGYLRANRRIPNEIITVIDAVKDAHPMDVLQTALIALAAFDTESEDNSKEANVRKALRLTAQGPTIVTAHHRIRNGLEPVAPNPDLNHAGNFLYMLFNEIPDDETVSLMDVDFILHAEHGVNASSFAARVAAFHQLDPARRRVGRRGDAEGAGSWRSRGRSDEDVNGNRQPRERRGVRPQQAE